MKFFLSLFLFVSLGACAASIVEINDRHFVVSPQPLPASFMRKLFREPRRTKREHADAPHTISGVPLLLTKSVLFAPDDDISGALQELIAQEHHAIRVAMYMFTDHAIAKSLIAAYERGVTVEVIVDQSCVDGEYKAISLLRDARIPLYVYQPKKKGRMGPEIMHNKFTLFSANRSHLPLVVTGSSNATQASKNHCENVALLKDTDAIVRYQHYFENLKTKCALLDKQSVKKQRGERVCVNGICY